MSVAIGERFKFASWDFVVPGSMAEVSPYAREYLVQAVLDTVAGRNGAPYRRSRHATTWKVDVEGPSGKSAMIFIKRLDPLRGFARLKGALRPYRFEHVIRISDAILRDGLGAARVLLGGRNLSDRSEVIVSRQLAGAMVTRMMNPKFREPMPVRRAMLRGLGAEVARFHRHGYIHGDLTPYNVFVAGERPMRFAFIDNERTSRVSPLTIRVARRRMRNLVQLGHFDPPGVSRTDKMRVLVAYAEAEGIEPRRLARKLAALIERRMRRDRNRAHPAAHHRMIARESEAGGR